MQQPNAAFKSMYQEYKTLVFNMALHYLQNREDAEEVTQDVFVKVYHSLDTFNHQSSPKTWLYRITINQCLDVVKKKNSRKRFFIFGPKSQDEKEYLNATTLEHPGILMEHREDAQILFDAINTLTENQKTAFLLSKVEGLPNPEIAAVMEVSISAVESLVFRAKASLQEKLGEKFETYRKKKK
ncbi:RNA polymerase sigma factor [Flavobacterium sedimenticola]|uniref:RNA polymerase sigma factor n=1 Tax=Flavobacterium sedimenticola TaxID=3043286 RepID=A0ABT6XU47_9FLAO|nr:RNA polymerase sigma factor [Flavobacterium sedimenticola]MDI9258347.1 RNA polymerase sigma factor [Flavobacterium sedimenticola]